MENRWRNALLVGNLALIVLLAWTWYHVGVVTERQRTVAVACTPNVDGVKRNGKEIPLTSAQRDSLSFKP